MKSHFSIWFILLITIRKAVLKGENSKSLFQEVIFGQTPCIVPRWRVGPAKNRQTVSQGSKSSNDNWWDHPSDLPFSIKSSHRTASQLRTVIDRIPSENGGIPPWEDQVSICTSWRNGGQENMIVDTWLKIGIREENIQVELGRLLCGTLLSLAMSPTTKRVHKKRKLRITIRNKYKVYGTD